MKVLESVGFDDNPYLLDKTDHSLLDRIWDVGLLTEKDVAKYFYAIYSLLKVIRVLTDIRGDFNRLEPHSKKLMDNESDFIETMMRPFGNQAPEDETPSFWNNVTGIKSEPTPFESRREDKSLSEGSSYGEGTPSSVVSSRGESPQDGSLEIDFLAKEREVDNELKDGFGGSAVFERRDPDTDEFVKGMEIGRMPQ